MSIQYSREGHVASILVRPVGGISFTPDSRPELNEALRNYRDDDDAWMAVVHCEGKDFCPGSELGPTSSRNRASLGRLWAGGYTEIWKPLIGAVQGLCTGEGLALALSCDLRVADATAIFDLAAAADVTGVTAVLLSNLVGPSLAFELSWLGRTLDSEAAKRIGLVNRIVVKAPIPPPDSGSGRFPMLTMRPSIEAPEGDAYGGALHFAQELLQYAPVTRNFQKETAYRSIGVPFGYAQTLELGPNPYASEDRIEGGRAFVENRRPVWRNR